MVNIIYWSATGNTEAMANMIAEGVKAAGGEPKLLQVSEASVADLQNEKSFALGCPAMGAEVLEETEMVQSGRQTACRGIIGQVI